MVILHTNQGDITLDLDAENSPATVANFLQYVRDGHYDNTLFHRVIPGFMIQGGGFAPGMQQKPTRAPVANEAGNGVKNTRYTVAMARTSDPHSATAQFFINVADNAFLDYKGPSPQGYGYCVFGKVVGGADVVDRIAGVATGRSAGHENVPAQDVVITRAEEVGVGVSQALSTMKPTLLLSDLHLAPERPAAAAAFHAFARGPARDAAAVYIMGDLFDCVGRRRPVPRAVRRARSSTSLRGISDAGVPVHIARGNRDFLLGERFRARDRRDAAATSTRSSSSAARRRCSRTATSFAPTTSATSAIARWSRDPRHQRRLLRLPYPVRRWIAGWLRRGSRAATARKPEAILDVNPAAVEDVVSTARRDAHRSTAIRIALRAMRALSTARRASASCSPTGTIAVITSPSTRRAFTNETSTGERTDDARILFFGRMVFGARRRSSSST